MIVNVKDSGIGIKNKNKPKLFKLFGSIKNEQKKINTNGIGLGLVISKMIVEKFDGSIFFESQYQVGSDFSFSFKIDSFKIYKEMHKIKAYSSGKI